MIQKSFFSTLLFAIISILLQVFLFNNISFQNIAFPLIYIIFIVFYPIRSNPYGLLMWAFLLGISVDFFDHTLGVHSFCSVLIALLRIFILKIVISKIDATKLSLKIKDLMFPQFFFYSFFLILVHHLFVFGFYDLNFTHPILTLKKTFFSATLSMVFVVIIRGLFFKTT